MRIGPQPIISRPAWYDRNPTVVANYSLLLDQAPHASTERISYTTPAGKKAMLEVIEAEVQRSAAATTVGRAHTIFTITPSGGSESILVWARIITNGVGDRQARTIGQSVIMLAGDKLSCQTADNSTGGTCHYNIAYKITQFDA